jgi:hypothetical protein
MAVTAVGGEVAKKCGETVCQLTGLLTVQKAQGEAKVKENKTLKCLGDRLKRYTIFYRRRREKSSICCKISKILARPAALISSTISIFRFYHCLTK